MKIAAIQTSNDVKTSANTEDILHLISQAKDLGADLVAFPECALTGFSARVKEIPTDTILSGLKKIQEASIHLNIGVLIPTAIPNKIGVINGAYFLSPEHNIEIHKTGLTDSEKLFFKDGSSLRRVFSFKERSIGVFFCREIHDDQIFSEISDAELILWPGYWGWNKPFQWTDDHKIMPRLRKLGKPIIQINFGTHPEHKLPPDTQQGCSIVCDKNGALYRKATERIGDILIVDSAQLLKSGDRLSAYSINKFESADLSKLKPLLDKSAGYDIGLEDELEYFNSIMPMNWFYICKENDPIGFIRCFPQGNWGTVELFIDLTDSPTKIAIAELLLEAFIQHTSFNKGFRLRFEIPSSDVELIKLIKEIGFKDRIETFLHYQMNLLNLSQSIAAHKAQVEDAAQIKNAIENLHEVTEEEVLNWIRSENVYIHHLDSKIASAAQVYKYGNSAEINRIATNSVFLRRGSALALLTSIHEELKVNGIETVFLKVDEQKVPARRLYEKVGYQRVHDKDQVWLSKVF